jgi:hypothetical protein
MAAWCSGQRMEWERHKFSVLITWANVITSTISPNKPCGIQQSAFSGSNTHLSELLFLGQSSMLISRIARSVSDQTFKLVQYTERVSTKAGHENQNSVV